MNRGMVIAGLLLVLLIAAVIGISQLSDDEEDSDILADDNETEVTENAPPPGDGEAPATEPTESPVPEMAVTEVPSADPTEAPVMDATLAPGGQPHTFPPPEEWVTLEGTITGLEIPHIQIRTADNMAYELETGPPWFADSFWPLLSLDSPISVTGFEMEGVFQTVKLSIGNVTLTLRREDGSPLWRDATTGEAAGNNASGETQVPAEEWVSISGTVQSVNNANMTLESSDGEIIDIKLGQPAFLAEQGVTFAPGDALEIRGYDLDGQFQAGIITNLTTGEILMLRDPNGRPLWGGPGRSGGGGGGNGGQGNGNQGNNVQGGQTGQDTAAVQDTGNADSSNGRQWRGGRNQETAE